MSAEKRETDHPPIHKRTEPVYSFDRLDMLWDRYPQYHEATVFSTLEDLLEEHESYRKDFDDVREEYTANAYDRFLIQLSWTDLPYRQATKELICAAKPLTAKPIQMLSWHSFPAWIRITMRVFCSRKALFHSFL